MALVTVTTGQQATATHINQFDSLFTGTMNDQLIFFKYTGGGSVSALRVQGTATAKPFEVLNHLGASVATIDDTGALAIGAVAASSLTSSGLTVLAAISVDSGKVTTDGAGHMQLSGADVGNADLLKLHRSATTAQSFFLGIDASARFYIWDSNAGAFLIQNSTGGTGGTLAVIGSITSLGKNVPFLNPTGASTAGKQIFTGTTTPSSPNEGDIWIDA